MTGLGDAIGGSFSPEDVGDLERGVQADLVAGILAFHQQHQTLGSGLVTERIVLVATRA